MKKNLFWAASLACLCASCASDAIVEENHASEEIRFKAFAEGSTRADAVYCPSNLPGSFKVFATDADGNLIIDGDVISKNGNDYVNTTATRYWPQTGTVTFEALLGVDKKADLTDFTVADAAASQKDLIYARATGTKSDQPVALNFRHALSQIVFKASNSNKTLTVEISKVEIKNVYKTGTYTLPTANTSVNIAEGEGHTGANYEKTGRGKWSNPKTLQSYAISKSVTLTNVTAATDITAANGSDALMLIPGTYTGWKPADGKASESTATYFVVTAKITQQVNATETPAVIWNGPIAIPADLSWEEGKRYVYTFAFGKGNGGYDPEDPEKPVFVPITFTVTVDEFVPVSEEVVSEQQVTTTPETPETPVEEGNED